LKLPNKVEEQIEDKRYTTLFESDLKRIDKITVRMEHGLESIAYHFIPKKCCNKLVVYHQGHRGDFIKGMDTIAACLQKGYSVMAFSMPLLGMNNKPTVYLERFGKFTLTKHEHLKLDGPRPYMLPLIRESCKAFPSPDHILFIFDQNPKETGEILNKHSPISIESPTILNFT
jgi:hypothetical protein